MEIIDHIRKNGLACFGLCRSQGVRVDRHSTAPKAKNLAAVIVNGSSQIHYLTGDATAPVGQGYKIIVHVCNDVGAWGAGFVLAISKRWRKPEREYRTLHLKQSLKLGTVQLVQVEKTIWIANMIAQHGIRWQKGIPPIRYDALLECLKQLGFEAHQRQASIHMPRIGCGLAGGQWEKVEPLILDTLPGTEIFVYDLFN